MFAKHIQRNSLIGPREAKTQNHGPTEPKRLSPRLVKGRFRAFAAVLGLTICTFVSATREASILSVEGDVAIAATTNAQSVQRADLIDDIIELLDKILNPPPPPPPPP